MSFELVSKTSFVQGQETILPGDKFTASGEEEFKRFLERGEAVKPQDYKPPQKPDTPEGRKARGMESR